MNSKFDLDKTLLIPNKNIICNYCIGVLVQSNNSNNNIIQVYISIYQYTYLIKVKTSKKINVFGGRFYFC